MGKTQYSENEETLFLLNHGWKRVDHGLGWQYEEETRTCDFEVAMLRAQVMLESEEAKKTYYKNIDLVDPNSFVGFFLSGLRFMLWVLTLPSRLISKIKW